ncbi:MAG TPA: helix-turn-helix transcriptional regulator [Candidatus Hydrogenedentes bacterium]|nr:helix-turn-helix transcriptional regulator [Candidatus Hydrogenedentota bacterium]
MSRFAEQGKLLRERREELGWTLVEVHEAIHVQIAHLRALETGDVRGLPGATFAAGFLKTYCQHLELDPEPFLFAFHACFGAPRKQPVFRRATSGHDPLDRPAWLTDVIAWGTVCAVVVFAWFTYGLVIRPILEGAQERARAGTVEAPPPAPFELAE